MRGTLRKGHQKYSADSGPDEGSVTGEKSIPPPERTRFVAKREGER